MKNKFIKIFVFLLPLTTSLSSCSDFRKAVGKEKVIPDEFSVAFTPSLTVPPGYKIDPEVLKKIDAHDPGGQYSINYMYGTTGIGYNTDKVDEDEVTSWSVLFDPAIASKYEDCGIATVSYTHLRAHET